MHNFQSGRSEVETIYAKHHLKVQKQITQLRRDWRAESSRHLEPQWFS